MDRHNERVQCVALSMVPGLGRRKLDALLAYFGTLDAVLSAGEDELRAVAGVGPRLVAGIMAVDLDQTAAALARWEASGISVWLHTEAAYPYLLSTLPDAPPVLYGLGQFPPMADCAVSIVGTRTPSAPALALTAALVEMLAQDGWIIVSGMALGIDGAAHRAALTAGLPTLAVLGCGVDVVYPPPHADLAHRIQSQGTLLAEVYPGTAPCSSALVARNRLITGLSRAVFVIEAGANSGSLHAARFAQAQGRAVFAVDNGAAGNRQLLEAGAFPLAPDYEAWHTLTIILNKQI